MADLNQRYLTYLRGLRNTKEAAHPTQPQDSSSSLQIDLPNVLGNAAVLARPAAFQADYNTNYYLVIP